jgi:hypothetical protein
LAIDKNRLREVARGVRGNSSAGSTGTTTSGASGNRSASKEPSGRFSFWIILFLAALWFFFGRGKKEDLAPVLTPSAQSNRAASRDKTATLDLNAVASATQKDTPALQASREAELKHKAAVAAEEKAADEERAYEASLQNQNRIGGARHPSNGNNWVLPPQNFTQNPDPPSPNEIDSPF